MIAQRLPFDDHLDDILPLRSAPASQPAAAFTGRRPTIGEDVCFYCPAAAGFADGTGRHFCRQHVPANFMPKARGF